MDPVSDGSCAFEILFTKNLPHILEKMFLSVDYASFKMCLKVNDTWNAILKSDVFRKKEKCVFRWEILKDEENLWEASENGNISVVKELLSIGLLDINCVLFYPNVKTTPLIVAAKKGHQDVVQLLLDHGAEIDKDRQEQMDSTISCCKFGT